jgi:FdrA protein
VAVAGVLKAGEYFDSVSLMMMAREFNQPESKLEVALVMGTQENQKILERASMLVEEFAGCGDSDLLIAVHGETQQLVEQTIEKILQALEEKRKSGPAGANGATYAPKSLESGVEAIPHANLALISVAGRYATDAAFEALEQGLNVMLFSDNISLSDEVKLKQRASELDLYLMGPDCGTAIIGGVPLAFANRVERGSVGIIAASGTGLQEVSSLISNGGGGVSHAIGTGGRDLKVEVGGITFLKAVDDLLADPATKIIVLISKPASSQVVDKIASRLALGGKPVVALFQGADVSSLPIKPSKSVVICSTLEETAKAALTLQGVESGELFVEPADDLSAVISQMSSSQRYLRGPFSGGTFCSEAQLILKEQLTPLVSNTPVLGVKKIADASVSEGHTLLDLGDDQFTDGRPHPMIDFSIRNQRILEEARDPECAVILLDLVLGYGANPDPLSELIPTLLEAQQISKQQGGNLPIICSVTGTDQDPQCRQQVVAALRASGVIVARSNAYATRLALEIISGVTKDRRRR